MGRPQPPFWLDSTPSAAESLASGLSEYAENLRAAGRGVSTAVVDAAIGSGWRGQAATAAQYTTVEIESVFNDVALGFDDAAEISRNHGTRISDLKEDIDYRVRLWDRAEADLDEEIATRGAWGGFTDFWSGSSRADDLKREKERLEGEVAQLVADAEQAAWTDGQELSYALDRVVGALPALPDIRMWMTGVPESMAVNLEPVWENMVMPVAVDPSEQALVEVGEIPLPEVEDDGGGGGFGFWDGLQLGLDGLGMIPAVGIVADIPNAGISGTRAIFDPDRRGEHLTDMGLSGVAAVPLVGIAGGAAKVGDGIHDASRTARAVDAASTGARATRAATTVARTADDIRIDKINKLTRTIDNLPDDHWLRRVLQGKRFDLQQAPRYEANQVYVHRPDGSGRYVVLDSLNQGSEIVSRKHTQLADLPDQAIRSLDELAEKYPPGARIASTDSVPEALKGRQLAGEMVLEVPPQSGPIPQRVLDKATELRITIRDSNGVPLGP